MCVAYPCLVDFPISSRKDPVFKIEAHHSVLFMFTESRVAFLWVCMMVMCREVERVQIEKAVNAGWSVRQIAVVLGGPTTRDLHHRQLWQHLPCAHRQHGLTTFRIGGDALPPHAWFVCLINTRELSNELSCLLTRGTL